ncbi:MAG: hypothetical protein ACP5LE_07510 [Thermoplasmata archaeon]
MKTSCFHSHLYANKINIAPHIFSIMAWYYASNMVEVPCLPRHINPRRIWIAAEIRVRIIKMGIEKAGGMNPLARVLGYRSRIHPGWNVQLLLTGERPFTFERLRTLCEYVDYPLQEVLKYTVRKEQVTAIANAHALREHGFGYLLK